MITRVTGSATSSSTRLQPHLAGDLAVGEVPVEPVADADLLDGDRGVRHLLQQHPDDLAGVEGHRSSAPRPAGSENVTDAVAGHRQHVRAVARQAEQVPDVGDAERRAAGRQHDVRAGVVRPADRLRPRAGADDVSSTCAGRRARWSNRVPSMSSATSLGVPAVLDAVSSTRLQHLAALQVGPQRLRAPAPSRPPAGGSRGSRRWCAGWRTSVPLSVASGLMPPWSAGNRPRMSRRRAWKSVQFEVEVSSR